MKRRNARLNSKYRMKLRFSRMRSILGSLPRRAPNNTAQITLRTLRVSSSARSIAVAAFVSQSDPSLAVEVACDTIAGKRRKQRRDESSAEQKQRQKQRREAETRSRGEAEQKKSGRVPCIEREMREPELDGGERYKPVSALVIIATRSARGAHLAPLTPFIRTAHARDSNNARASTMPLTRRSGSVQRMVYGRNIASKISPVNNIATLATRDVTCSHGVVTRARLM